jgi:hypothetical protein
MTRYSKPNACYTIHFRPVRQKLVNGVQRNETATENLSAPHHFPAVVHDSDFALLVADRRIGESQFHLPFSYSYPLLLVVITRPGLPPITSISSDN